MNHTAFTPAVFLTLVRSTRERAQARLLIDSLRAFGGTLRDCPVWLFEADPQQASCASLADGQVIVRSLNAPDALRCYDFGDKVYACAQAEALAGSNVQSLIWADPGVLFVQPPLLYDLGPNFDAAVRPVHIRNIGAPAAEPLDDFWTTVYSAVGAHDVRTTVEAFVDGQPLRAYFNTHAFAVNPARGVLCQWRTCFEALLGDQAFQSAACRDARHRIFLHQAVFSTLIAARLDLQRVRILPLTYNYPYNLHASIPPGRRAHALDDLVCATYEERSLDPAAMDDLDVREPLRTWLAARVSADPS